MRKSHQQILTEDFLRQEFELTLHDRVARYLQVKPHGIIPNTHFAAASSECSLLFRDGHFYGCIALSQAVAEALVRFLCEKNPNSCKRSKNFETNVDRLFKKKIISTGLKDTLLKIWEMRDDYHHLKQAVETDRRALEELARTKTRLLAEVESEVFRFRVVDGKLLPEQPKYWQEGDSQGIEVFLRLEP